MLPMAFVVVKPQGAPESVDSGLGGAALLGAVVLLQVLFEMCQVALFPVRPALSSVCEATGLGRRAEELYLAVAEYLVV